MIGEIHLYLQVNGSNSNVNKYFFNKLILYCHCFFFFIILHSSFFSVCVYILVILILLSCISFGDLVGERDNYREVIL